MITLTINGAKIQTKVGSSVLTAAQANDIWIPTLCHHEQLSDYGACRLCLVEIIGRGGRSKVTTSCTLPATDGLEVITESERLTRLRRLVMELILAACPHNPALLKLAAKLGVSAAERLASNPRNDCILCGLCVRACREISRTEAIAFAQRGVERRIMTPFNESSAACLQCGACVFVCPTGSRLLDLAKFAGAQPSALLARFDAKMVSSGAISRPFPQAVPNVPAIDPQACLKLNRDVCGICEKVCEAQAIRYQDSDRSRRLDVGAIIAAPGFEAFDPVHDYGLGYSSNPDVITSVEFERILSASGPYGGRVQRPSDGRVPQRIAFLQCVGSRDLSCRNGYCSSVCCMYAVKEAVIAKEHEHSIRSTIFLMDMRASGKDFDKFVERAQSEYGILFKYSRVAEVLRDQASGENEVIYTDDHGRIQRERFDLVVLAVGMEPPGQLAQLARVLGVRLNEFGFLWTEPLRPLLTSRAGLFVAGAAAGPGDIPESVVQASAAAGEAARLLAPVRHSMARERSYPAQRNISGEPTRIGVFVCHCGLNIGGVVDVPSLRNFAASLTNVVHAEDNLYTCSQDAQKLIQERIAEHRLNRVVVASCSPRTHEALFQETLREAGLNPHLFVMANIRDQCSWVHQQSPEEATTKAKDLVRMAVAMARLATPLPTFYLPLTPVALVLGGGLSGMTAALAIADQGYDVNLVEKARSLGGNLRQLYRTLSAQDLQALLHSTISRLRQHPRIKIHLNATLSEIKGFVGNYEALLSNGASFRHGAIVLATGASAYQPKEYGYGRHQQIITQLELSQRLEQGLAQAPASVIMIQCVGSREEPRNYCSRVCCSLAVQNAIRLKELYPNCKVHVLYRDIRTYGMREPYYTLARDKGVLFTRFALPERPEIVWQKSNQQPILMLPDPLLGMKIKWTADLVVLSTGMITNLEANNALAKQLKVPLNEDGFFLEAHAKLRPVDFATEGIFVAGLAHGPKSTDESIVQALAAAGRTSALLARKELEVQGVIAAVDTERCLACGLCQTVCAFGAIALETESIGKNARLIAKINPALCKGCGVCSASCRGGAITLHGCSDEQILAGITAL